MSHTKEPWAASPEENGKEWGIDAGKWGIAICADAPGNGTAEDNARRIVACVNACAGFSNEELDGADLCRDSIAAQNEIDAAKQQRDQLLAALTGLHHVCEIALAGKDGKQHSYFETRDGHFVEATNAMERAEAAIAAAKGGAA